MCTLSCEEMITITQNDLAAFDRLGTLEGEVGEVKAAQLTQMILNSKLAALEPLLKEIEKPLITTPAAGDQA